MLGNRHTFVQSVQQEKLIVRTGLCLVIQISIVTRKCLYKTGRKIKHVIFFFILRVYKSETKRMIRIRYKQNIVVTSVTIHIFSAVNEDAHFIFSEVIHCLCLVYCYVNHFIPQVLCLLSRSEGYMFIIFPSIFSSHSTVKTSVR